MAEKSPHRQVKGRAAGRTGKTEQKIKYGGRIDVLTSTKAIEIERGGKAALKKAVRRLERVRRSSRILKVPEKNFKKAIEAAKRSSKKITVTNLIGSRRRQV